MTDDQRVTAYAEAIQLANNTETRTAAARAVIAVADQEQEALIRDRAQAIAERDEARAEVDLWHCLGRDASLREENAINRAEAAEAEVERLADAAARHLNCPVCGSGEEGDCACPQVASDALAALAAEREAHTALRASLSRLSDEWDDASDREQPLADKYAGYHQGVVTARRNASDELRDALSGRCQGSEMTCYTHGAPWVDMDDPTHCAALSEQGPTEETECHVEIGGQRITEAQFHAARRPLLDGVASLAEGERLREVWGRSDWDGSDDSMHSIPEAAAESDTACGHCGGAGCVACDAWHLPEAAEAALAAERRENAADKTAAKRAARDIGRQRPTCSTQGETP